MRFEPKPMPSPAPLTAPPQSIFLQNVSLLRIYSWYRVALATVLIAILIGTRKDPLVGHDFPQLFIAICGGYLLFVILILILLPLAKRLGRRLLFGNFVVDIGVVISLHHISGGSSSGLSLLLLVCTAASSLLLSGQVALLIPALGSLAILGDTLYLLQTDPNANQSLLTAGTQGILLFATSLAFQMLSQRLRATQKIALERDRRCRQAAKPQSINRAAHAHRHSRYRQQRPYQND